MRALRKFWQQDRGAALVTMLLLVAMMAMGAAVAFERLGYTIKRSTAAKMQDQARFYALGGEMLARTAAEDLYKANTRLKAVVGVGDAQAISYPIDGGQIDGLLQDASNCFNVNSLVRDAEGRYLTNQTTLAAYTRLLTVVGLSEFEAEQLAATLADWLDSDSRPQAMGAEDYDYMALTPAYRAANTLMVDISELRLVKGYGPKVRAAIEPLLCARTDTLDAVLNVNTLKGNEAPLLVALVGPGLDPMRAQRLIAERPASGYGDVAEFWQETAFSGITLDQQVRARVTVKPQAFMAQISVTYYDAVIALTSIMTMSGDGKSSLVSRSFGVGF